MATTDVCTNCGEIGIKVAPLHQEIEPDGTVAFYHTNCHDAVMLKRIKGNLPGLICAHCGKPPTPANVVRLWTTSDGNEWFHQSCPLEARQSPSTAPETKV